MGVGTNQPPQHRLELGDGGNCDDPGCEALVESHATGRKGEAAAAGGAIGEFDASHRHVLTWAGSVARAVSGVAKAGAGAALAGVVGAASATGIGAAPGIPATNLRGVAPAGFSTSDHAAGVGPVIARLRVCVGCCPDLPQARALPCRWPAVAMQRPVGGRRPVPRQSPG